MTEEIKEVKKRGRKKKEVTEEPETPSSSPEETVKEVKKRGRKPKATI